MITLDKLLFVMLIMLPWILVLLYYAVRPYIILQRMRRESRAHLPMPREIWMQDEDFLFIDHTDNAGVVMFTIDKRNKTINRWRDSWAQWEERLQKRTVWFTGRTQT